MNNFLDVKGQQHAPRKIDRVSGQHINENSYKER